MRSLHRIFNLYSGEGRLALLFVLLTFLWSFGAYLGLILSEGMFLQRVGAHALPVAYLSVASLLFPVSLAFLWALNKFSVRRIFLSALLLGILTFATFLFLLTVTPLAHSPNFWFAFKLFGWVFPVTMTTCFWAFVDQYYGLQDAKRLFCLFNSATFLGDACGGVAISLGIDTVGLHGLLIGILLLLGSTLPIIFAISKRMSPIPEEETMEAQRVAPTSLKKLILSILRSRFTLFLILSYFVIQLLAIIAEYNTMETFSHFFAQAPREGRYALTEFVGKCSAFVSLGNLLFGLFIYSRLVKRIGTHNLILFSPLCFLLLFLLWPNREVLSFALFGLIAREGIVYSFDDNNFNLLIHGVPPRIRSRVRVAMDSFFEPSGMFLSALLLLFWPEQSKGVGLALACLGLTAVYFLRRHHFKAMLSNLEENTIRFDRRAEEFLQGLSKKERRRSLFVLFSTLKNSDESLQLFAYESLLKMEEPKLLSRILQQSNRLTLPGKLEFIELLASNSFAAHPLVIEHLERWRRILPHPPLRGAIHLYFVQQRILPYTFLSDIESDHLPLRGAALAALEESPHKQEAIHQLLLSSREEEQLMGVKLLRLEPLSSSISLLLPFLESSSLLLARQAAASLALCAGEESAAYTPQILERLLAASDSAVRLSCLEALGRMRDVLSLERLLLASSHLRPNEAKLVETLAVRMGEEMAPIVLSILKSTDHPIACRLLAGKVVGRIDRKELQSYLHKIVSAEAERASFYDYHSTQSTKPFLKNALFVEFQAVTDFIVQLIGVASCLEDGELLAHSLRSKNPKIYGQAVETLSKSTEPRIFLLLQPLIDRRPREEKLAFYSKHYSPLSLEQLLQKLQNRPSTIDRLIARSQQAQEVPTDALSH